MDFQSDRVPGDRIDRNADRLSRWSVYLYMDRAEAVQLETGNRVCPGVLCSRILCICNESIDSTSGRVPEFNHWFVLRRYNSAYD